ncbi:MAG TPA: TIGR02757 family protein [Rectinemataceae bacterium]|nr:TIGR02757 family protein [Rectinemataceae bacterium]
MTTVYDPAVALFLEEIYSTCAVRQRLRRDPLAVVRGYPDPEDREVAALVCSTLAFGSVDLIMRACAAALAPLGDRPARSLDAMSERELRGAWSSFQYRFCFPHDMTALMRAIKRARADCGSLQDLFVGGDPGGEDIVDALVVFVSALRARSGAEERESGALRENLLPSPSRGSACKRLFLFLRWMVRSDEVDPGGWDRVNRSRLVVPLDLHMLRVCTERLGLISSPYATLKNALAATRAFRLYAPDDPVKYDFALTRPGIDPEPGDERFGCR